MIKLNKIKNKIGVSFYVLVAIVLLIMMFGCSVVQPIKKDAYELKGVYVDPKDIKVSYNNVRSSNICFDIVNNALTTLSPRIELSVDENCFETPRIKEMGTIAPGNELHSCLEVYIPYDSYRDEDYRVSCQGKKYQINMSLQDVSGTELKGEIVSVGII